MIRGATGCSSSSVSAGGVSTRASVPPGCLACSRSSLPSHMPCRSSVGAPVRRLTQEVMCSGSVGHPPGRVRGGRVGGVPVVRPSPVRSGVPLSLAPPSHSLLRAESVPQCLPPCRSQSSCRVVIRVDPGGASVVNAVGCLLPAALATSRLAGPTFLCGRPPPFFTPPPVPAKCLPPCRSMPSCRRVIRVDPGRVSVAIPVGRPPSAASVPPRLSSPLPVSGESFRFLPTPVLSAPESGHCRFC